MVRASAGSGDDLSASPKTGDDEAGSKKKKKIGSRLVSALKEATKPGGFLWGVLAGVTLAVVVVFVPLGGMIVRSNSVGGSEGEDIARSVREKVFLYDVILQDVSAGYVDYVDVDKLFEASVQGMLGVLDPYSQFETRDEAVEMGIKTKGKFGGVGLGIGVGEILDEGRKSVLGDKWKGIVVVSAFEGYAYDSGVRPGDVVIEVDGTDVNAKPIKEVTEMLRGPAGTSVSIGVLREGVGRKDFVLSRKTVALKDVPLSTLLEGDGGKVGYVRLQSFAKDAAEEVAGAVSQLEKESNSSGGLKGLVLDLRGNPGGLLDSAIKVAEVFVPKGSVVVSTKGRGEGPGPIYLSDREPLVGSGTRVAVLVNGQSASASEVVAGAVQDLDAGIIVGTKSFGKGLVQQLLSLPGETALKFTSGRYYTPSGRCIQALTYSDKAASGAYEAKEVPEAERKEFFTRNGRVVRDGGGIEPDVVAKHRSSFLEVALGRQNMFFHFASRFAADKHAETLPESFAVTDTIFRDFVQFVASTGFKYESRFDEAFVNLDDMFKEVGYEGARGKVDDLRKATIAEMRSDFTRHERDIKAQLDSAIRFRLEPDSKRLVAELKNDEQVLEAVRLLRSPGEYRGLLSAKTVIAGADKASIAGTGVGGEEAVEVGKKWFSPFKLRAGKKDTLKSAASLSMHSTMLNRRPA